MQRGKGVNLTIALPIVLLLAMLAVAPLFASIYYLSILMDIFVWLALSISWQLFSGSTNYISLGSAAFFGVGWYFAAEYLSLSVMTHHYLALPLPLIVLLAGLVNFVLALAIGVVTLRLRGIYFVILTFAISQVAMNVISSYEAGITHTFGTYTPIFSTQAVYYTMLICAFAILLFVILLRRSKFGLGLKMIGQSEEAAAHVGVNTGLYKILGFAVSAMLMGFVGGCYAIRFSYVNADMAFDFSFSLYPAVMTLLGGVSTILGPIIGSVTITSLSDYFSVTLGRYFLIILGLVLIIIVVLMPDGIMGMVEKVRTRVSAWINEEKIKAPEKPP
jgi:branched-chain amino acid transport system permease protein